MNTRHTTPRWLDTRQSLPPYGVPVILCLNGVVQHETFQLAAGDTDDPKTHWWERKGSNDDCPRLEGGQLWQGMPLAPDQAYMTNKDPFDGLSHISARLHSQDNRITSEPMFCVQEKVQIYGVDSDYSSDRVMSLFEDGVADIRPVPDSWEEKDALEEKGWEETGVYSYWKTVMASFTEVGAQQYLDQNGHNLDETRIYVESFNRCPEMVQIRRALMTLTEPLAKPPVSHHSGEQNIPKK